MINAPRSATLYRNYRKSSDAHCSQKNQKVAAHPDIQCFFQLLDKPVREKDMYIENPGIYK